MLTRVFAAFRICLHSHTCLPMPKGLWEDDLQPVSEVFLPAVGLAIGFLWWMLAVLCRWFLPAFLGAALVAVYPLAVTGFENLFSFVQVSGRLLDQRKIVKLDICRQILPVLMLLLQFSVCMELRHIFALVIIPVLPRSVIVLKQLKDQAKDAEDSKEEAQIPPALMLIERGIVVGGLVLMLLFAGFAGLISGAAVLAGSWGILRWLNKDDNEIADAENGFVITAAEFIGVLILTVL